jgi:cytidylate kinase
MSIPDIIIAVDCYSSTGKSTFAKLVASEFAFLYLDSGAMYRGVTLAGLEAGVIGDGKIDEAGTVRVMEPLDLHFRRVDGTTQLFLGDRCIEKEIRGWEVSQYVSPVSAVPAIRAWVDDKLHAFAAGGRVIMDGRDIGTTVFPDAQLKIFMTADEGVRARRRYEELVLKGEKTTLEEVAANLRDRDYRDSHRPNSPLRQAEDAVMVDSSALSFEETVEAILAIVKDKTGVSGRA